MWIVFMIIAAFLIVTANVVILGAIFNCFRERPKWKDHSSGTNSSSIQT